MPSGTVGQRPPHENPWRSMIRTSRGSWCGGEPWGLRLALMSTARPQAWSDSVPDVGIRARRVAAGVVARVDQVREAAARDLGERAAQRRDHAAVAGHAAEDRHARAADVAADP